MTAYLNTMSGVPFKEEIRVIVLGKGFQYPSVHVVYDF